MPQGPSDAAGAAPDRLPSRGAGWREPFQIASVPSFSTIRHQLRASGAGSGKGFPEQVTEMYETLFEGMRRHGIDAEAAVTERIFLSDVSAQTPGLEKRRGQFLRDRRVTGFLPATTIIEQPPAWPGHLCEVQVMAMVPVAGTRMSRTTLRDLPAGISGSLIRIDDRKELHLAGVTGDRALDGPGFYEQAAGMFERADRVLQDAGFSFRDVARTWICLSDIDRDYHALNSARRDFFASRKVAPPPASTGIRGAPWPPSSTCVMDLVAMLPRQAVTMEPMRAETLNEAPDYGSDFSRGMRVEHQGSTLLYLSGTASIDTSGHVVHLDDIEGQVERMLVNVEQLFAAQGASYDHVVQAITYLKRPEYLEPFVRIAGSRGLPETVPHTLCIADVCRPEWLCELEAIAVLG